MNILSITLDPLILDSTSVALKRQHTYYEGHDVDIVSLSIGESVSFSEKKLNIFAYGGISKPLVFLKTLGALVRRGKHYDVVTAQDVLWSGFLGYLFTRLRGGKLLTQLHGDYLDNPKWIGEKKSNILLNTLGKFVLRKSDSVRCVSRKIQNYIVDTLHIAKSKTVSIPIGTDLTLFRPDGERAEMKAPFVMFVGRLLPEKSPMLYCEAMIPLMKKYETLEAVIAGDGPMKDEIKKAFAEEGFETRTHFLGHIGAAQIASYYRASTALLHTAGWEGWGMPMIEALACGCPVVTSDTGCAGEAVCDNVNGIVVPIDDVKAMEAGVERLLGDPALQKRFSESAKEDALQFSFASLSIAYRRWYETV